MSRSRTHLIPLVLQAALSRRNSITVFGRDDETEDGTCIRDYSYINELCGANALALDKILAENSGQSQQYNLGNGGGPSVQQVINTIKKVVAEGGFNVEVEDGERRSGDPAVLVADAIKAKKELAWEAKY